MAEEGGLKPGERVADRYRIVRQLGSGGMGIIYLAEHLALRRDVALKVLRADLVGDEEHVARFEQEARAASAIGHPHIVDVFDLGRLADGSPFMAMEFLDGMSLADYLAVEGPLPWPRVVELGAQVLSALAAAHNRGVVHRDLKPENVFLVETADRKLHAKLLDFGISKVLANARLAPSRQTSAGTVIGTVEYMAPEQARGQIELVDERTDVYATGVLLYELFSGRPPFRGDSYHAVLASIIERRFVPLATLDPEVPPALEAVVSRALADDRARRWQSAEEMRAALLAAGTATTAAPSVSIPDGPLELVDLDRWGSPPPAFPEEPPSPVEPVPRAPIELAWVPPPAPPPEAIAPPPPVAAEPPPRRRRTAVPIVVLVGLLAGLAGGAWLLLRPSETVPRRYHRLPPVAEEDVPALAAQEPRWEAPSSWEDLDRRVREAESVRACLGGAPCAAARAEGSVGVALDDYRRVLAELAEHVSADLPAAELALRRALWNERTHLDLAECDLLGGVDASVRRRLIAARAALAGPDARAAVRSLITALRGDARPLATAGERALARGLRPVAVYDQIIETANR